jgi:hypothetical protein
MDILAKAAHYWREMAYESLEAAKRVRPAARRLIQLTSRIIPTLTHFNIDRLPLVIVY